MASHDKSSQEAYGQLIPRSEHNLVTPTIAGQQKRWKALLVEVGIFKMILSDFAFTKRRKIKGPQKMDDANRSIDKFYMTNICWKHVVINTWWTLHMSITISFFRAYDRYKKHQQNIQIIASSIWWFHTPVPWMLLESSVQPASPKFSIHILLRNSSAHFHSKNAIGCLGKKIVWSFQRFWGGVSWREQWWVAGSVSRSC